ncbi:MAG TPA: LysR family transcriptional regulator [Phycisphaerae bacterium]|nr:LysR family transcriptional regulator [Phycisphaerae bacterium]
MPRVRPGPRRHLPPPEEYSTTHGWEGRLRLWVDFNGRSALGPGKARLLEAIDASKSLSEAARQLRMSYRLAWKHLRVIEERTGITVVRSRRGGHAGGQTELTREGKALLRAYGDFRRDVEKYVQLACDRHFRPPSESRTGRGQP